MEEYLVLSFGARFLRFESNDIFYIKADGNSCKLFLVDGGKGIDIPLQMHDLAEYIKKNMKKTGVNFIRVGKSYILNRRYIQRIDVTNNTVDLYCGSSGRAFEYDVYRYEDVNRGPNHEFKAKNSRLTVPIKMSREALLSLKSVMEK